MAKSKTKQPDPESDAVTVVADWERLTDDQQYEVLAKAIQEMTEKLDLSGADPELISAALFSVFVDRMSDSGDREQYDDILQEALDTEWPEHTVH